MTLKELKDWVKNLPESFDEYEVMNAEYHQTDEEYMYRLDKPVTMLTVSESTKEILILNYEEEEHDEVKQD